MPGGDSAAATLTFGEMWTDSTRDVDAVSASDGASPWKAPVLGTIIHTAPAANITSRPWHATKACTVEATLRRNRTSGRSDNDIVFR